jgi:hypothetical protein
VVDALPAPLADTIFGDTGSSTMLLSVAELNVWLTGRAVVLDGDAFAEEILFAASEKVRSTAGQPTWTAATAPPRARQICAHLAARSYLNPDSISAEGGIGPLGGDRTVEELAKALHLTQAETDELQALAPRSAVGGSLWIQPVNGGVPVDDGDVYLADDSGSDWMIPYLAEHDLPALG